MDPVRRAGRSALARLTEQALLRAGLERHRSMLVAVSGGVDSTALLLLAAAVARRRKWRIEAATVDHHLRDSSALDAAHACHLAESIGVPCHRLDVFPGPGAGAPARARRERYAALARLAAERSIGCVLTAHQAHDQLETMLLSIVRGSGVRAAGGMALRRGLAPGVDLVRPLLEVPRPALERLCRSLGLEWREDPTNARADSPRVLLRRHVTPVLESMRPGAAVRAARLASLLRSAGRHFERRARQTAAGLAGAPAARVRLQADDAGERLQRVPPEQPVRLEMDRRMLRRLDQARRLELLRSVLAEEGLRIPAARLREIAEAISDARDHLRRWEFPQGQRVEVVAKSLRVRSRCSATAPDPPRR